METVLNYYWMEQKVKNKMKQAVIDAVLQPPGCLNVGYLLLTQKTEVEKLANEMMGEISTNKNDKIESQKGILEETLKDENVFIRHVSSWNIMWPDGYHNIRECPYLIEKQILPLIDIKNNPMYKKSAVNKLPGVSYGINGKITEYNMKANPPMFTGASSNRDDELIKVTLYNVWNMREMNRFTLAENLEEPIFEAPWEYLCEGFLHHFLIFNEIPQTDENSNSYPLSDIVPMFPQLKELSYLSSAMLRHRKRAGSVLLAQKGMIEETDATNIQNASDLDIVFVNDISKVTGLTPPGLPNDFYALRGVILDDLMRISGFNQLLNVAKGINTATESENVRMGAMIRQQEKVDQIEDFTVEVATSLMALIWQYIDRSKIEEIVGEKLTEEMWPSLPKNSKEARRIIREDIYLKIEAGSTRPPKDEAVERKQWMDLVGVLQANYPGRLKQDGVIKQILKKFDYKDIDNLVISFDEEESAVAQEENKLLMQGIQQLVSPNENHMLHLQVHSLTYNTPGVEPTPQMDEHILKHNENVERQSPTLLPQRGDNKAGVKTNTPDLKRAGVPTGSDILGATRKIGGVGGEEGGRK
jgi:hypothetical protein